MFPLDHHDTPFRKLTGDFVSTSTFEGRTVLKVAPEALTLMTREGFRNIEHLYRPSHLAQLRAIWDDPEASANDRFVAFTLLKNAVVSSAMVLPSCQDTGTAIVVGKKGQQVWTEGTDERDLSLGVYETFTTTNLRYSQLAPLTTWEEVNTKTNLPAQTELYAVPGDAYDFLMIAKGGGSANKTFLFQETKAVLNPASMETFLRGAIKKLGTAACPPYHLAVVIGGLSAEMTLKTVKLASCRYLDGLPSKGSPAGHAIRDRELEQQVLELTRTMGIGAQFGGKYFCHDVRVIRLPRHGASCPVGIGVSCSADRQVLGRITADGVFLEQLETDPARYLPDVRPDALGGDVVAIDLNRPMAEIRAELSKHPIKTRVSLTGTLVVARDIAHAKLKERVDRGEGLPDYFLKYPVYYAGPAKTPEGMPSGSFGPTTAARMDPYVDLFQSMGGSMVMLAKGNRSQAVTDACKKHGGFYLGSIGGPAAVLARDNIRKVEVLDMPELGMEAVWKIEVEDFPAFVVVDDKGNDFFA
ncbi:MAG: fumarate hydratase [Alphaproteobacteria bacterium]|nr:fumarate hydratase [Alphaproteobacteria bacterium]